MKVRKLPSRTESFEECAREFYMWLQVRLSGAITSWDVKSILLQLCNKSKCTIRPVARDIMTTLDFNTVKLCDNKPFGRYCVALSSLGLRSVGGYCQLRYPVWS